MVSVINDTHKEKQRLYRIALPASLTHSHPFFKKNNPFSPIFQEKQPIPTYFSTKTTHSYLFFDNNDPFSPIFQDKKPIPTHFLTKATHSHPFLMEKDPLPPSFNKSNIIPPIFQQIRPTPTYFSTKATHSYHSRPFFHRSSAKVTCIHQFSNYNRLSLPVIINALNELSLENIIFEYSTSEKKRKAYFSKKQIYPSILLNMKYGRQYIT